MQMVTDESAVSKQYVIPYPLKRKAAAGQLPGA